MKTFRSFLDYLIFASKVMSEQRFIYDSQKEAFLSTVLATSESRQTIIKKGHVLWRAQLGYHTEKLKAGTFVPEKIVPYKPERMIPDPKKARGGRANPVGIPYLYLADEPITAMAEVRPWLGEKISLGKFQITHKLKVIDFSKDRREVPSSLETLRAKLPLPPKDAEEVIWSFMNNDFSKPVTTFHHPAEYIPTQIISELFKESGFDGIVYRVPTEQV